MLMRIRSVLTHSAQVVLEGALIGALVVGMIAGTTLAARGGNKPAGGGGTSSGACSVSPNVVARGSQYQIDGSGFKGGELLNVWVTDSHGTQSLFPPVAADGTFTATSYASWAGDSVVKVYDNGGRKMVYLTSCTFSVQ